MFDWFKSKKQVRLVLLGLDNSGKTTFLRALCEEGGDSVSPTCGFNIKHLTNSSFRIQVWDVGGQRSIREHWSNFYQNADGIIYVVDSADAKRLRESALELFRMLTHEELAGVPLLVLANKQDLRQALSPDEIMRELRLDRVLSRRWIMSACSAKTKEGLQDGLTQLLEQLSK